MQDAAFDAAIENCSKIRATSYVYVGVENLSDIASILFVLLCALDHGVDEACGRKERGAAENGSRCAGVLGFVLTAVSSTP